MSKTIVNNCNTGERCILEINGFYFGYDNHPAYPETIYKEKEKAHIFNAQRDALAITTWHSGKDYVLHPVRED